jgi:hypothetical protein
MRLNRFAPWLLLGCLIIVTGCGKEKAVPSSGPVGHVVVVKGEVRAQRAAQRGAAQEGAAQGGAAQEGAQQKARLVQVDDVVFADDTIVTSGEASVQILITHNGALWELGERSSRRIDKGIAFRATKKGEAPLDRKELVATAAAGRNTTREAGDSVGTIMADETRPLPQTASARGGARAADLGAAEPRGASAAASPSPDRRPTPAPQIAKPKPAASPPPPPSQPTSRGDGALNESAPSKTAGGLQEATANETTRAKRRRAQVTKDQDQREFDSEADEDEPADRLSPSPAIAKERKGEAPGDEQRAYLVALVRTCQKTNNGTGTLRYKRKANGQLTVSSTAKSLAPLVTCVKRAIRSKAPPNKAAVSGSLQL